MRHEQLQFLAERRNFLLDPPAVKLQARFPGAAVFRADAAALAAQRLPQPDEARQHVFELCDLHLQLRFPGFGPLRKNIEDQHSPVDHFAIQVRLQIADLRRGQLIVENDEIAFVRLKQRPDLG